MQGGGSRPFALISTFGAKHQVSSALRIMHSPRICAYPRAHRVRVRPLGRSTACPVHDMIAIRGAHLLEQIGANGCPRVPATSSLRATHASAATALRLPAHVCIAGCLWTHVCTCNVMYLSPHAGSGRVAIVLSTVLDASV
jgi:hypothetical protein